MTTSQPVSYWSEGDALVGDLFLPAARPSPAIVFCNGWGGLRDYDLVHDFARRCVDADIALLAFDYRGFGDSGGRLRGNVVPVEYSVDIRASVAYLRARPEIDDRRVALMGMLTGAAAGLHAASFDETISAVVAMYPFGDGERWLRSMRTPGTWASFRSRLGTDATAQVATGLSRSVDPGGLLIREAQSAAAEAERRRADPRRRAWRVELQSANALRTFKPEDVVWRIAPRPVLTVGMVDDVLMPFDEVRRVHQQLRGDRDQLLAIRGMQHFSVYTAGRLDQLFAHFFQFLRGAWAGRSAGAPSGSGT